MAVHIEPPDIIQAVGIDHQCVALPLADRVALVRRLRGLGERTSIHEDLAVLMIGLKQNRNRSWSLDNLAGREKRIEIHHAVPEAPLRGMAFLPAVLALF